jgi:serine acetyltransferase
MHVGDFSPCTVGRTPWSATGGAARLPGRGRCLIGMQATILDDAVVGEGSLVGAGALVTQKTVIPPRSLVLGRPPR